MINFNLSRNNYFLFFTLPTISGLCYIFFQWMHSISHWVWLLTGCPCTPYCFDSFSTLWCAEQKPQTDYEKLFCPRPSTQSSSPPGHLHCTTWADQCSFCRGTVFTSVHSVTDSGHSCTDKCHLSVLSPSDSWFMFFFCWLVGGYRPIFSIQGWPHGASSCHHDSRRS